uniref:Uncharacterized protein n=1 Tax=Anguilla anguilla TaxID=7936 RepID=A0A0E9RBF8_ANGAN
MQQVCAKNKLICDSFPTVCFFFPIIPIMHHQ